MNIEATKATIEEIWENRELLKQESALNTIHEVLAALDVGTLRCAEPTSDGWKVNEWVKKAVILYFPISKMETIHTPPFEYHDKIPLKTGYAEKGIRVVPPGTIRHGAYVSPGVVVMPSYINIGAYVDAGTMVDTWATVGSCAQIGKNVHLSGGVGIGGVLEPLQASPTIIEDNCFIGARSEIVEGVVVGAGAVVSMGVYIGQSTRILDRETGEVTYGYVPPGSVVVSGSIPADDGSHSLYCAVIVKKVDEKTRSKVGINELLRSI